jgi:hypothetical protein
VDQVLGGARDAVLGGEERGERDARQRADGVDRVGEVARDRGLMAQEADAASLDQAGEAAHEHVEAGADLSHDLIY